MRYSELVGDIKGTVKGLSLKVGDVVDFYGMGKDEASEHPTRCVLSKAGNGYRLSALTGEVMTWEFGTAAKIHAVFTGMDEVTAGYLTDADVSALEAKLSDTEAKVAAYGAGVAELHASNAKLGELLASVEAGVVKLETSAPVKCTLAGDGLAIRTALKMVHADPCTCVVEPVMSDRAAEAILNLIMTDGEAMSVEPVTLTDAQERAMIVMVQWPHGLTESDWRYAGIAKRTMDVLVRIKMVSRTTYTGRGQVYLLDTAGMAWCQARVSMSPEQAAITYPTPTAPDVAAMTGDPVGWVNDLVQFVTPTNTPDIDGYEWKRHVIPGDQVTACSTYQLIVKGSVCQVAATVRYVKDGLWQATGCAWMSTGLTAGYWQGESLADAFAHVVTYIRFVESVRGRFSASDINRMDWSRGAVPVVNPGDMIYRDRDGAQGVVRNVLTSGELDIMCPGGAGMVRSLPELLTEGFELIKAAELSGMITDGEPAWDRSIARAGTDTMRAPMRTKLNKRKRNITKRNRRQPRGRR